MLDARCAVRRRPVFVLFVARRSRVSACFGSMPRTAYRIRILPEPMSRNGLSLVRNSAFATIAESMFPSCTFDIARKTLVNPFDLRLLRSASVSRPMQGDLIAGHPLFTRISRALPTSTASTPPQACSALRIKAFNRSGCKKLTAAEYPIALCSPMRFSCDVRIGSTLRTRFIPLSESFREPWN